MCDIYEKGISLFGLSKSFALPGTRIGWLSAKEETLIKEFCQYRDYTTICSSATSEILAIIALRNADKILSRNLKIIETNLNILDEFFGRFNYIFSWQRPMAGPIAFPQFLLEQDVEEFCIELVNKQGVLLLPASVYNFPEKNIRFGFGRKNTGESIDKLYEYLVKSGY